MLRSDPRIHYKMYKAKKDMVYATLFSFAVLGGLGLSQNAEADTVENNNVTPAVQTTVNSAQSTTGATPQSMPTQSAVPTQSPAAALNAVNSAPTAQPVSAQPIVNSQDGSASNVASQTQITTLNVQSGQPAQNFAATNLVSLYAQNLMQNAYSANAQDVSGNFELSYDGTPTHNLDVPKNQQYTGSMTLNFNVKNTDLKLGNVIYIGNLGFTQSTQPQPWNPSLLQQGLPIKKDGQDVGTLAILNGDITFTITKDFTNAGPGMTNFSIALAKDSLLANYQYPASEYAGVNQDLTNTLQLRDPQGKVLDSATVTFTAPQVSWTSDDYQPGITQPEVSIVNPRNGVAIANVWFYGNVTAQQAGQLIHNNGDNQFRYSNNYQFAVRIEKPNDNSVLVSSNYGQWAPAVAYNLNVSDGAGHVAWQPWQFGAPDGVINQYNMGDGLTLSQMKAQIKPNSIGFSQQSDGSIIALINANYNDAMKPDLKTEAHLLQDSYAIASLPKDKRQAAIDASLRLQQNGVYVGAFGLRFRLADTTVDSKATLDLLDLNTGKVTSTNTSSMNPSQLMAHGQAAVKLHVINATNGTELNQWRKLMSEARNKKIALNEINH